MTCDSWEVVNKEVAITNGKSIIGTKWAFKKKQEQDGQVRYKSRMVAKGYQQIPGVDYTKKFAPVAHNMSTKMILLLTLWFGWTCHAAI